MTKDPWRWVGLVAAAGVYALAIPTYGIALLLAPVSFTLSVVALRRLDRPRGPLPWLGFALNIVLSVLAGYVGLLFGMAVLGE